MTVKTKTKPSKIIRGRYYFDQKEEDFSIPSLLEVQLNSYDWFVKKGIKELFDEVSPIIDFSEKKMELHLLSYTLEPPKYDPLTCKRKNVSYESNLKVKVRLLNKETGEIKEQEVFFGAIPLMTDKATFVVNGIERVVVNQFVRSPGVFYSKNPLYPKYFNAKIIPKRGAWLEIESDKRGMLFVKIDRKRKIYLTSLLRIFGFDTDQKIQKEFKEFASKGEDDDFINKTLEKDSSKTVDEAYQAIYRRIRPGDMATAENAKQLIESMFFDFSRYDMGPIARYKINKRFNLKTKDTTENRVFQVSDFILIIKHLLDLNQGKGEPDDIDSLNNRRVRPVGELAQNKFRVGLLRTERIAKDRMTVMDLETVTASQLINCRPVTAAMKEFFAGSQLAQFMDQTNPMAEFAHKRRLSAMGPGGLSRERATFDVRDVHTTHYCRICPIATHEGPNIGLVVHLATYSKVNNYGFIETPYQVVKGTVENKAEKLTNRIAGEDIADKKGKIIVKRHEKISDKAAKAIEKLDAKEIKVRPYLSSEFRYFDVDEEKDFIIAQAGSRVDEMRQFAEKRVASRNKGEPVLAHVDDVTHIDVSPQQIISLTTALIPFLEHDDNTRASMGSNMQRQAVPLITPDSPVVGTGMERIIAESSGEAIVAPDDGVVESVDANKVKFLSKKGKRFSYEPQVFLRTNQSTAINQRVKVSAGQKLKKGDVIIDGTCIQNGELALGKNLTVAYMAWRGYNFEDAIIISERLAREGIFDSVHIETYTTDVRETKLGPELVTRDIPNISEEKLKDLDEEGIVRIGAKVREGDILVGKITPKGEVELTAEERFLRAIFGEKAKDVKDTALRLPGGEGGKVVNVEVFSRENSDDLETGVIKQIRVSVAQTRKISVGDKMAGRHGNKGIVSIILPEEDMPYLENGKPVDIILNPLGVTSRMNIGQIFETHLGWAASELGIKVASPALGGVESGVVKKLMKEASLPEEGKVQLYDGLTGEPFENKTTVGTTYMMKLAHLVEDKMHARSVGPYSLVTQQPLGGKAQHGGQRFGEMEVWALEAYGAAHALQEMLTIKSDDIRGRARAYESIVKGESIDNMGTPESFNVLIKELQGLSLDIDLDKQREEKEEIGDDIFTEEGVSILGTEDVEKEEKELDIEAIETQEKTKKTEDKETELRRHDDEEVDEDMIADGDKPIEQKDSDKIDGFKIVAPDVDEEEEE